METRRNKAERHRNADGNVRREEKEVRYARSMTSPQTGGTREWSFNGGGDRSASSYRKQKWRNANDGFAEVSSDRQDREAAGEWQRKRGK